MILQNASTAQITSFERSNSTAQLNNTEKHLSLLHDFIISLSEYNCVGDVIWGLMDKLIAGLGFDDCVVYLVDESGVNLQQKAAFGLKNPRNREIASPLVIPFDKGVVGTVASSRVAEIVADTRKDKRYIIDGKQHLSELAVPIVHNNKIIGVLDSEHDQLNFYTEAHLQYFTIIATILSTKLSQIQTQSELDKTTDELHQVKCLQTALTNINAIVTHKGNTKDFYNSIGVVILQLLHVNYFSLRLCDEKLPSVTSEVFASEPNQECHQWRIACADLTHMTFNWTIANRELISHWLERNNNKRDQKQWHGTRLNDEQQAAANQHQKPLVLQSGLGIPLTYQGNKILGGLLVFRHCDQPDFSKKDKEVLTLIAQHISMALICQKQSTTWRQDQALLEKSKRALKTQIGKRKSVERKLQFESMHDSLTGLPNRHLFMEQLNKLLREPHKDSHYIFSVLYLNLDHFKKISKNLGCDLGDILLKEAGRRIASCLRAVDMIARFDRDEFAVIIRYISGVQEAKNVAERICAAIAQPFKISDQQVNLTASIGMVLSNTEFKSADNLIKAADVAMVRAKNSTTGSHQIFEQGMDHQGRRAFSLMQLENDLRDAITQDQFEVHYQPIVRLKDGIIVGFEALARWRHPQRGMVMPLDFIPLAEETGLIVGLDWCIVRKACRQLKTWRACFSERKELSVNVNMSSKQFSNAGFTQLIAQLLEDNQLPTNSLKLEVTEWALLENISTVKEGIQHLKKMGVSLVLDDFGTGYSSLSYLNQFPVDVLKIDVSFVAQMNSSPQGRAIVETIIVLAKTLHMDVVAEGIETASQYEELKMLSCDFGQGYYMSKPVEAEVATVLLQKQKLEQDSL